jgi:hypothetical protein
MVSFLLRSAGLPLCWMIVASWFGSSRLSAQQTIDPTDSDTQAWMGVQIAFPLRERLNLIASGTFRQGRDLTHPVYEAAGASLQFRVRKYLSLSPIYQFVATQPYAAIHVIENRFSINCSLTKPWKNVRFTNAHQLEERVRLPRNSQRYRSRLQVECPFQLRASEYQVFMADEVFYDSITQNWNRNRFFVGGGKRINSTVYLDVFLMKQNGTKILPRDVSAVGMTIRVKLDRLAHHLP